MKRMRDCLRLLACLGLLLGSAAAAVSATQRDQMVQFDRIPGSKARNIVFILADDHRYDAMGFMNHPFLKTPAMDAMARDGMHLRNAFVTTALCSPSRASLLTGLYAHRHRVVDNNNPVSADLVFFPQILQAAGYQTAFMGKWHMGGVSDAPQRGFDRWVSFRGQGTYNPSRSGLNIDGKNVPQRGYITDELTDYAVDWLKGRDTRKPFFLYLSHKGVHAEFEPAPRHAGRYANAKFPEPASMADTPENYKDKPLWVRNQRNSWHGVDFAYHRRLDLADYYRRYCETLLAVDDSIGRVMKYLRDEGLAESTLVVYMGDNGFLFGEHGLIDKRCAYEESMRVPALLHCPELTGSRHRLDQVVANIDLAPTLLEAAGVRLKVSMDGRSFLPLLSGKKLPWRDGLLYEYYWERDFPQTPSQHAIRTDRYKYIRYHGIWDIDELYDIQADPHEMRNLIHRPEHRQTIQQLNRKLFEALSETEGLYIPLHPDRHLGQQNLRSTEGAPEAKFPPELLRSMPRN